jgi:phospholipase/carboxylesterase
VGGRVRLLNAPLRKVTINYGSTSTSWYDIFDLSPLANATNRFDLGQVRESLAIIDQEVTSEIELWRQRGVTGTDQEISKRIFIGGFSQGCAMSLCYGLTAARLLGGVIGYSGHLFEGLEFKNIGKAGLN